MIIAREEVLRVVQSVSLSITSQDAQLRKTQNIQRGGCVIIFIDRM